MAFYDDMAATVTELLDEFGREMALRRMAESSYDPATGETTGGGQVDLPTVGLFRSMTAEYAATNQVLAGDRLAIIDASQEPRASDRLVAGAEVLTIVRIESINPAGTPLAYRLQVRS